MPPAAPKSRSGLGKPASLARRRACLLALLAIGAGLALLGCDDPLTRPATPPPDAAAGVPDIVLSTRAIDFGRVTVGNTAERDLAVSNRGDGALRVFLTGLVSAPFAVTANTCGNRTLAPGSTCTITFSFSPGQGEGDVQTYVARSTDPDEPAIDVVLRGHGRSVPRTPAPVVSTPTPTATPTPTPTPTSTPTATPTPTPTATPTPTPTPCPSYSANVHPQWLTSGCVLCHNPLLGGLDLTGTAAATYPRVVTRVLTSDPCQSLLLLKPSASVTHSFLPQALPGWEAGPPCPGAGPAGSAYETTRQWIVCGALNN